MSQAKTGKGRRRQKTDGSEWDSESTSDSEHVIVPELPVAAHSSLAQEPSKDYAKHKEALRQKHLKQKEYRMIQQLKQELAEYQNRSDLTKQEFEEYEYKSKLYDAIKSADAPVEEYELPEEYLTSQGKIDKKRKLEALNTRSPRSQSSSHNSHAENKKNRYENSWEHEQLRKAQAMSKTVTDDIVVRDSKQYEYVFDESQFVKFDSDSKIDGDENTEEVTDRDTTSNSIEVIRKSLPVYQYREAFLKTVNENQVIIVVGETGSGKTTQLPQYLYEAGYCEKNGKKQQVGCTQPRRVAATSVAARVAEEMQVRLGEEVGYSIRFEDMSSSRTAIKYLTDGILLREFLTDPTLSAYSAVMIDEAHERTISTEVLLSLVKDITKQRKDLKIIVASATINAQKFSDFFDQAPIFSIPGRRFPVNIHFTKQPEANYIQAAINTIFLIHSKKPLPGDILVFLTGQEEIESMQESLAEATEKMTTSMGELLICPIYANLPYEHQRRIFEPTPPNTRKVVLATNIAETSITIDGIKYVIDCGYVKENVYNPSSGMDSLVVVPCSKASADQRAGRAGRVGPGECFRLFTKWSFDNELSANPTPEILRGNLISTVLLLLSLGVTDLVHFEFMDPPSAETLIKCLELLYAIGALNSKGELTKTGRQMANFPIHPMFSKALLESVKFGVAKEIVALIAMLGESSNLFYRPKDKKDEADKKRQYFNDVTGDHLSLLNIWNLWSDTEFSSIWCQDNFLQYKTLKRAKDVKEQLELLCRKTGIIGESEQNQHSVDDHSKTQLIQKAIVAGFFPNIVRLSKMGDSYRTLKKNQPVYIHPSSSLFPVKPPPKLLLYHELVLTSREYMRNCMIVEETWLRELASHYYGAKDLDGLKPTPINRFK
ncbi:DEAD-like ATP-dependent RNA helicase [Yamadazyma tenuis]|nr:DEAD-like ATP-dependent RNA helicase [Yamadazyma tenuis]